MSNGNGGGWGGWILLLLVGAGVWLFFIQPNQQKDAGQQRWQYTDAILEVYQKIDASYAKSKDDEKRESEKWWQMGFPGVMQKHFDRISNIDTRRCPPEFQQAFSEYLIAMKALTHTIESTQGWGAWFANFVTVGGASLIPAFINSHELAKDVRDAEFKMKRIAIQYDLTFK
jgi:hypothetical protein